MKTYCTQNIEDWIGFGPARAQFEDWLQDARDRKIERDRLWSATSGVRYPPPNERRRRITFRRGTFSI